MWPDPSLYQPRISMRQEIVPHILKAEPKFNKVWLNEHIRVGGSSNTIEKIIPRDPCKNIYFLVEVIQEANQIIPEPRSNFIKVWQGLENIDKNHKILPQ